MLLDDLNPPQREAVLHTEGALLVLAGAGSGKTRVITRRVAHLVRAHGISPYRILAVTFTNKAAREMRERLVALLGDDARRLVVSTFHSAAAMILRREADKVGLSKSFVIYDDSDQLQLVKRAMREAQIEIALMNPREVLSRIDREKNAARTPENMQVEVTDYRGRMVQAVYRVYQRLLRSANAVDFGDLLLLLVDLLRKNELVRTYYQRRFEYVLVDEFQDTNPVQYELLRLLCPPGGNLAVVGDDDQSIYRWRGADVDNILGFPKDYPDAKVVKLEQNYRSDQNILDAAHAVIANNPRRMAKKLWSERPKGEPLGLMIQRDERAEAQGVADAIHSLVQSGDGFIGYGQIAVFFRTNAQSRVLEEALRLGRVPYALVNGRSFYERAEIKDAAAYLRLMVNPKSDADLLRIINTPARGIGDTTVERLTDFAASCGRSLFECLSHVSDIPRLNAGAAKRLAGFRALVESLSTGIQDTGEEASAAEAVERMLAQTGLVSSLMAEGSEESRTRAENLQEFLGAAQEFDVNRQAQNADLATEGGVPEEMLSIEIPPLQAFLEGISLVGDADADVGEGKVSLMTLHSAKGLEFDAVFLTGMEDGVFPHSRALNNLSSSDSGEELSEERRLCYVGFTRARKRLTLSLAVARSLFGELRLNPPSRFLAEVPQSLFQSLGFQSMPLPQRPASGYGSSYGGGYGQGRSASATPPLRRRPEESRPTAARRSGVYVDRSYDQTGAYDSGCTEGSPVGSRVRHSDFGEGRVVSCDGSGPNAKLTVNFPTVGLKRVVARFLQPS